MNAFDLIVYISLAWAVFNGWRKGFLLQMLSLVAIVAAIYLAAEYGSQVGLMIGLEASTASIVGFIVIFLVALVGVTILAHMMRAVFRFAGLGIADVVLGIILSVVKVGLIVAVLFAWFDSVNKDYEWASKEYVEESRWYEPISGLVDKVTPYFEQFKDKIFE
ncbi:MAG: CvpA family protein [Alistipes sp.]|nr:CvpA family protein [Alistipes sp.]